MVVHDSRPRYKGEWLVKRKGRGIVKSTDGTESHHNKKAAMKKMQRKARDGEKMIVFKRNGRIADGYPAYNR